jgi:FtsZ-binding cell division protein ZapB
MTEWATAIATIVAALLGGGAVGWLTVRQQRRKLEAESDLTRADAASRLTGAALDVVEKLRAELNGALERLDVLEDEVKKLQQENKALQQENRYLLYGTDRLTGQVLNLGAEPVWRPRHPEPEPGKP